MMIRCYCFLAPSRRGDFAAFLHVRLCSAITIGASRSGRGFGRQFRVTSLNLAEGPIQQIRCDPWTNALCVEPQDVGFELKSTDRRRDETSRLKRKAHQSRRGEKHASQASDARTFSPMISLA